MRVLSFSLHLTVVVTLSALYGCTSPRRQASAAPPPTPTISVVAAGASPEAMRRAEGPTISTVTPHPELLPPTPDLVPLVPEYVAQVDQRCRYVEIKVGARNVSSVDARVGFSATARVRAISSSGWSETSPVDCPVNFGPIAAGTPAYEAVVVSIPDRVIKDATRCRDGRPDSNEDGIADDNQRDFDLGHLEVEVILDPPTAGRTYGMVRESDELNNNGPVTRLQMSTCYSLYGPIGCPPD